MSIDRYFTEYLPVIEDELKRAVMQAAAPGMESLTSMLFYHMGWEGEGAGAEARGKRIRPILVALTAAAAGADWRCALPAAVAVELIHNFSLVHDDIEDNSPLRRGRPTVWVKWGIPQAVNLGDTLFALANLAILGLCETVSPRVCQQGSLILHKACLSLTQGQYLDLAYENRNDLAISDYWPMVSGKTAALLSACTHLGALAAQSSDQICQAYQRFGHNLGLAFQTLDDLLGIWGDAALTGKSTESDLVAGKKTLPVLFGLRLGGPFARRWLQGPIHSDEVADLAVQLEEEGGRAWTQKTADELTDQAMQALRDAHPQGDAGEALAALANKLLKRAS